MFELKTELPADQVLRSIAMPKQELANSMTAATLDSKRSYFLSAVEVLERTLATYLLDSSWYEVVHSPEYWAVRDITEGTERPYPLIASAAGRIIRWLEEFEQELERISRDDEWEEAGLPRIILDTSALVREGEFDTFDWPGLVGANKARLIIPILAIRELDNLKNFGREPKARRRLRRIAEILDGRGRGPADLGSNMTLELLMDPPRHSPLPSNDEEIIRRSAYVKSRKGGPLRLITGDYRLLFSAQAEGIPAEITPAELRAPDV